jgi:hypothetical protein
LRDAADREAHGRTSASGTGVPVRERSGEGWKIKPGKTPTCRIRIRYIMEYFIQRYFNGLYLCPDPPPHFYALDGQD